MLACYNMSSGSHTRVALAHPSPSIRVEILLLSLPSCQNHFGAWFCAFCSRLLRIQGMEILTTFTMIERKEKEDRQELEDWGSIFQDMEAVAVAVPAKEVGFQAMEGNCPPAKKQESK